jgi:hypothetical protein
MRRMPITRATLVVVVVAGAIAAQRSLVMAQSGQDFLSPAEADKVRNAFTPSDRAKLFIFFAEDRLKKFQYELGLKETIHGRDVLLNGLLNGYADCMDEASERIADGQRGGADMREAIKFMQKQAKEYLDALQKVKAADGPELDAFKDSLNDALDSTQDALKEAGKAAKEYGAVPIRRKP